MPPDPSKTEKATPKRRKKAREDGNVGKSQELSKLGVLIFGVIVVRLMMGTISEDMQSLFAWFFRHAPEIESTPTGVYDLVNDIAARIAHMVLPILLTMALGAYIINRIQVGSLWTTKVFKPKLKQFIEIPKGIKKCLFDLESIVRLVRSLGGAIAVGIGPVLVLLDEMPNFMPLFHQPAGGVAVFIMSTSYKMVLYSLIPSAIIAVADTVYSFWKYEDGLKMSKDEVKDEQRQALGDPKIKSKQKEKMMAVGQQRMLSHVPKADVVVTNPTHLAIALKYDTMEAPAPLVVAKGGDFMAKRIREIAKENGVPIRENKPLARALYEQVEVGDVIPEDLYKAVASILARLKKYKKRMP